MLHLRLRVKRVDEASEEYVRVLASLEIQQTEPLKNRIHIGIPCSDEEQIGKEIVGQMQKMFEQKGVLMMPQKPLSAEICMFIQKQYFNALGRPTIDDYIELNARTDRRRPGEP